MKKLLKATCFMLCMAYELLHQTTTHKQKKKRRKRERDSLDEEHTLRSTANNKNFHMTRPLVCIWNFKHFFWLVWATSQREIWISDHFILVRWVGSMSILIRFVLINVAMTKKFRFFNFIFGERPNALKVLLAKKVLRVFISNLLRRFRHYY